MASRRKSKGKRINPTFYVFCEGQTEEEYVKFLRSEYRVPIEINSKRTGDDISQKYIKNYLRTKTTHQKDQVFLMYDLDVDGVLSRLNQIEGILLVSNPCLELWFLLHHQHQRANIASGSCVRQLCTHCPDYEKGKLSESLKKTLSDSLRVAVDRAEQLQRYENPSTTVNDFIAELEAVIQGRR